MLTGWSKGGVPLSFVIALIKSIFVFLVKLQVLKESFHPQAATRVRMWLNEAEEEGLWLLHTVLFIKDR